MSEAFDAVKAAEKRAGEIISEAKGEAALIKKELILATEKAEENYFSELNEFQSNLFAAEKKEISSLEKQIADETNRRKQKISDELQKAKPELILTLTERVIDA